MKDGKLFGKLHILDVLIIIAAIAVGFTGYVRLSGSEVIDLGSGSDVTVRYEVVTYDYREDYFTNLVPGAKLAEEKKYIDAKIISVEIIDSMHTMIDNNGKSVIEAHPYLKKAIVTIEGTGEFKDPVYRIGTQEIHEAKPYFITTELAKISGITSEIEIIE